MAIGELSKVAWKPENSYPDRTATAPAASDFSKRIEVGSIEAGRALNFADRETLVGAKTPLPQIKTTEEGEFSISDCPLLRKGAIIPLFKYGLGKYEWEKGVQVANEVLVESASGGETTFTLAKKPVLHGSLMLLKNNDFLSEGTDFTINDTTGEITLTSALSSGDKLIAFVYIYNEFNSTAETTLSSDASSGDTTISVADATDLKVGVYIKIQGLNDTYKIKSISGNDITLGHGLESSVLSGAEIYTTSMNIYTHKFYAGNEDLKSFAMLIQDSNLGTRATIGNKIDTVTLGVDTEGYWKVSFEGKFKKDFTNAGTFPDLNLDLVEPFKFDQTGLYINGVFVPEAESVETSINNNLEIRRALAYDATPNDITGQKQEVEISLSYELTSSNYDWYKDYLEQKNIRLIVDTGKYNTDEISSGIPYQFRIIAPECRWAEKNLPELAAGRLMVDGSLKAWYNDKIGYAIMIVFINSEEPYF